MFRCDCWPNPDFDTLRLHPCTVPAQLFTQLDMLLAAAGYLPHLETQTPSVCIYLRVIYSIVQWNKSETETQE